MKLNERLVIYDKAAMRKSTKIHTKGIGHESSNS